jgi:hypothetical protein
MALFRKALLLLLLLRTEVDDPFARWLVPEGAALDGLFRKALLLLLLLRTEDRAARRSVGSIAHGAERSIQVP